MKKISMRSAPPKESQVSRPTVDIPLLGSLRHWLLNFTVTPAVALSRERQKKCAPYRVIRRRGDICGDLSVLVLYDIVPAMFVLFADVNARGIVMVL